MNKSANEWQCHSVCFKPSLCFPQRFNAESRPHKMGHLCTKPSTQRYQRQLNAADKTTTRDAECTNKVKRSTVHTLQHACHSAARGEKRLQHTLQVHGQENGQRVPLWSLFARMGYATHENARQLRLSRRAIGPVSLIPRIFRWPEAHCKAHGQARQLRQHCQSQNMYKAVES